MKAGPEGEAYFEEIVNIIDNTSDKDSLKSPEIDVIAGNEE